MVRPRSGSPRVKHRSYTSDYGSQNGGEHPRAFHSGRGGGGPGKAPPGWREAHNNRGRKAPYPDRPRSVPWQQKSPQARDHGPPSPWQSKSQENYLGYASSSQPSDAHRRYGDPAPPRPGLAQRRPSPHDPSLAQRRPSPHDPSLAQRRPSPHDPSLARSHHSRQYDGGPRGFQSRPQNPDHRSHNKQVYPQPPPHHRSPFRTPRQEEQRPWGSRSQSPSCPSRRPLPKHQHIMTQAGDRGRGRGGRGRGGGGGVSGNGCGRQAFWGGDRGPADRGNPPYPSPRAQHHHPQPRNGEGRCPPSNSPLRKEREFHSRERWSSSTERDHGNERRSSRERMERMGGPSRHGNEPEQHWPPPSPSQQYRPPPPHPPSSSWKAGPPPPGPHSSSEASPPARRFQRFHHNLKGTDRGGSSGYKWKFPEMLEQPRPHPPPLFKHFQREPSLAPPPRGFGGRGLSLRDKSRLLKNRKFREDSVARFKTTLAPPPAAPQQQPRMAHRPPAHPDRSLNPRHHQAAAGHHVAAAASARKLPKRSSSSRKAGLDDSPEPVNPAVSESDQDQEHKSPQYRRRPSSSRHSPILLDHQHLSRDLVVVSQWEAGSPENDDGDCDDDHGMEDQEDVVKETSVFHSNRITGPQEPQEPKATASSPQEQNNQNKRLVRRPLMSLKTVRPLKKFGQMAVVATKRSQCIVSKYRLMRLKAPPTPARISQPQQSTSHRRW